VIFEVVSASRNHHFHHHHRRKKEEACNSNTFCPINRVIEAQFIIIFYGILLRCYYYKSRK